jgi:integrase
MDNPALPPTSPATENRTVRRPNAQLRTREHLTTDEVERLIETATANRQGHRDGLMILLAFRHGLRAAEVCDLRWEQVDFKVATLHVRRTCAAWTLCPPRSLVFGMGRVRRSFQ